MRLFERIRSWFQLGMPERQSMDHVCVEIKWSWSDLNREHGASPDPLICAGQLAAVGPVISRDSTLNTIQVDSPDKVAHVCTCPAFRDVGMRFCGVLAMSRPEFPGEAYEAIRLFRANNSVPGAAIYGAWDYNVARAAERALSCRADGILMPGIEPSEMLRLLAGILSRVQSGESRPQTVQEHEELLRTFTTEKSPFWKNQHLIESPHF